MGASKGHVGQIRGVRFNFKIFPIVLKVCKISKTPHIFYLSQLKFKTNNILIKYYKQNIYDLSKILYKTYKKINFDLITLFFYFFLYNNMQINRKKKEIINKQNINKKLHKQYYNIQKKFFE